MKICTACGGTGHPCTPLPPSENGGLIVLYPDFSLTCGRCGGTGEEPEDKKDDDVKDDSGGAMPK